MRLSIFLSLIFFFSIRLSANVDQRFQQANEDYKNNKYDKAIEQYESLIQEDYKSEELYYNLGNSYYKKKALGKAILYYEKALLLDRDDEDTLHNLSVAKAQTKNEISTLPPFFLARWWAGLRGGFSSSSWSIIGLIFFWMGIGGLVYWLMAAERRQKKIGFVMGICSLIFSMLPFTLAYNSSNLETDSRMAIVLAEQVPLRSAPDPESTQQLVVYEGLKVELLDRIDDWSKVRLMNGEQGWLPMTAFARI